jgi:hypothetical protein
MAVMAEDRTTKAWSGAASAAAAVQALNMRVRTNT